METEIPVLSGSLIIPTQSGFSLNQISKKKSSQQKHCLLFKASRHGIERLEICDKDDSCKAPKIITLENCVKITQEAPPANLIHIVTRTGTFTLNTLNEDDLREWITALQQVAFKGGGDNSAIEEDNDLYCSVLSDGIFPVKLVSSDILQKCHLESKNYLLQMTATELQLRSIDDNSVIIVRWPYRFIRKYGYRVSEFTFEAGRKCETGEGIFMLEHPNPQEVFRCMTAKMKHMKKILCGESTANLDCGEVQFNAALSMEAGSRSPLPPSPIHQKMHYSDTDLNTSGHILRGFLSSNDSLNNVSTGSAPPILTPKPVPRKPPRKIVPNQSELKPSISHSKYDKYLNYEPVTPPNCGKIKPGTIVLKSPPADEANRIFISNSDINENGDQPPKLPLRNESKSYRSDHNNYESIELITNAWKTLGLNEVKHTEECPTSEEDVAEFSWQRSQSQKDFGNATKERKMQLMLSDDNDQSDDSTYDRLNFIAQPKNKPSSDYKTIVTINSSSHNSVDYKKQISQPITMNDYEMIGEPDIKTFRLADDSYLGYGMLRVSNLLPPITTTSQSVHHVPPPPSRQCANNNNQQTIISSATTSNTMLSEDEILRHSKINDLEYAIVSKPKRV